MREDHARGVTGGIVDLSGAEEPSESMRAKVGRIPSFAQGFMRSNVAPSNPTSSNLFVEVEVSVTVDGYTGRFAQEIFRFVVSTVSTIAASSLGEIARQSYLSTANRRPFCPSSLRICAESSS